MDSLESRSLDGSLPAGGSMEFSPEQHLEGSEGSSTGQEKVSCVAVAIKANPIESSRAGMTFYSCLKSR